MINGVRYKSVHFKVNGMIIKNGFTDIVKMMILAAMMYIVPQKHVQKS